MPYAKIESEFERNTIRDQVVSRQPTAGCTNSLKGVDGPVMEFHAANERKIGMNRYP
jgi:hypothetical protein